MAGLLEHREGLGLKKRAPVLAHGFALMTKVLMTIQRFVWHSPPTMQISQQNPHDMCFQTDQRVPTISLRYTCLHTHPAPSPYLATHSGKGLVTVTPPDKDQVRVPTTSNFLFAKYLETEPTTMRIFIL